MEKLVVESMNIDIELNGKITHVIGPTNSGKTYLLKKLINIIPNKDVYIDNQCIKSYDIDYLQNNIVVCLNDEVFYTPYVYDELSYHLTSLGLPSKDIVSRVKKILDYFSLEDYQTERIDSLPLNIRMLVKILSYLIIEPELLCLDNVLIYLDNVDKESVYKYIKKKKISLISVISDLDDIVYGDKVLIMNHLKAIMYGDNKIVMEDNSIIPYMGIRLPFIVDLSQNLRLYGVVDKVYMDIDKLVKKIWK